jgi:hypothetical protein
MKIMARRMRNTGDDDFGFPYDDEEGDDNEGSVDIASPFITTPQKTSST